MATIKSVCEWIKCGGVVLYNGYSVWRAYRTRPVFGSETFWPDLKAWLTTYNPTFQKIAAASPPTWDDKLSDAIADLLHDETLWSLFKITVSGGKTVPDETSKKMIRERIRLRRAKRFLPSTEGDFADLGRQSDEETESIVTVITFLSLIASSASIIQFIRNWRKERGK